VCLVCVESCLRPVSSPSCVLQVQESREYMCYPILCV